MTLILKVTLPFNFAEKLEHCSLFCHNVIVKETRPEQKVFSLAKIFHKYLLREEICCDSIVLHTQIAKHAPWIMNTHIQFWTQIYESNIRTLNT